MNTQNVNVKTAAQESSRKMGEDNVSTIFFMAKFGSLTTLIQLEGQLMMIQALRRMAIIDFYSEEVADDAWASVAYAAKLVNSLKDTGAITSPAVYEIILSVESLALDIAPDSWKSEHPEAIASLQDYKNEASQNRQAFQEYVEDSRRPFGIEVSGRVEYPEDDAMYGTYFCDGAVSLGRADTLAQAIQRVKDAWISDDWNLRAPEQDYYDRDLGHDCGPVSFRPVTITISDLKGNIVLTGDAKELEWHNHITCQADINKIQDQQKALREEAAYENGWDNHETARQLRGKAEHLNAGIVSEAWRGHPDVTAAINAFVHPRVELDEEMMFEADQPESWC